MSFLQAYYTSCETGLRGGKGFQVNAATAGLDPSLLQQVERLGLYVPPVDAPSRPTAEEIDRFPVSLLYQRLGDGCAVLAQAKYLGTDYSGRFGNYFTHSLVSLNPAEDIQGEGFLPIEMWRSETWDTRESPSTSLAPLDEPRTGNAIDVQAVEEFLHDNNRLQHVPAFLTAVESALGTGRRIVVVADSEAVALWIAAASYALPSHLALQLTFNTYVKNPYQSEFLIVGTTADSDFKFAPHEIEHQYFVFDFQGGRFTPILEISGFAAQVEAAYREGQVEGVAGFSRFVEHVAPNLQLEELDTAFDCYSRISGFAAAETDAARIIKWCANHIANFRAEQMRLLLSGVMNDGSPSRAVIRACTDLFLASQSGSALPEMSRIIDSPYIEWLIRDVSASAPIEVLVETASRLQVTPALATEVQPLRLLWMKQLRKIEEPARLCMLLQLGERLNFLEEPDDVLRHLGKIIIGPLLNDVAVQRAVTQFADKPGVRDVIYGVGEYLATQISQPLVFTTISEWLAQPQIFSALAAYAAERKDLNLYFRLLGTQATHSQGATDAHLSAFQQCLAGAECFGVTLTTAHLDNAFKAVWQDSLPTVDEALQLLAILQPEQIIGTNIPKRLADLIATCDLFSQNPKQKELLNHLWERPLYDTLGEKTSIIYAYNIPIHLPQSGEELFSEMEATLQFLEEHRELNEDLIDKLYQFLAECLVQIKDIVQHRNLLVRAYQGNGLHFISSYGKEVETALSRWSAARARIVARLFETWISTETLTGTEPARTLLMELLPRALKDCRRRELESVDKGLVQNRTAHLRWINWREAFQEKGLLPRFKQLLRFKR
jgi:hypothetical protein